MLQTIDTAESNFPASVFILEEDTAETGESDWLALICCTYAVYEQSIDPTWQTDVDE